MQRRRGRLGGPERWLPIGARAPGARHDPVRLVGAVRLLRERVAGRRVGTSAAAAAQRAVLARAAGAARGAPDRGTPGRAGPRGRRRRTPVTDVADREREEAAPADVADVRDEAEAVAGQAASRHDGEPLS